MGRHSSVRGRLARSVAVIPFGAGIAMGALALANGSAHASTQTWSTQLGMTGIVSAQAPSGGHELTITAGDTVTFGAGAAPARSPQLLGFFITLSPASFPDYSGPTQLHDNLRSQVTFANAGAYDFGWAASNTLGALKPQGGEYTSGTIVVVPQSSPSSATPSATSTFSLPPSGNPTGTGGSTSTHSANAHGFHGPSDSGLPTTGSGTGIRPPSDSGIVFPTGAGSASPSSEVVTSTAPPLAVASNSHTSPPTLLAVLSILALAVAAGLYAYNYFGGPGLRNLIGR